jgi:hypothetical protein
MYLTVIVEIDKAVANKSVVALFSFSFMNRFDQIGV